MATKNQKVLLIAAAVVAIVVVVLVGRSVRDAAPQPQSNEVAFEDGYGARGTARPTDERTATVGRDRRIEPQSEEDEAASEDDSESKEPDEPQTEEEKREVEEERLVNDFDDLTDKWMEFSASKSVTMSDIDNFAKAFRKIPKARQDECIHRALNLIPDESVMLLAGILMDKSMDREIVETVYNDILNRDEDVKKPILQQIFKDKSHPCWADTAWILDVTGELPKK